MMDLIDRLQDDELYIDAVDEAVAEIKRLRELGKALFALVEPLKCRHPNSLCEIARDLKRGDAEYWPVGEMLERALLLLDAMKVTES